MVRINPLLLFPQLRPVSTSTHGTPLCTTPNNHDSHKTPTKNRLSGLVSLACHALSRKSHPTSTQLHPQHPTHDLSIPELLHVLNEKLGLEHTRFRDTPLPPEISVASLESQIETLETRVREILVPISSLWNLLRPINRLPPEIISRIARGVPNEYAQDARSIIPLTHVCRYWRESIISAPENWTLVSSESEHLAALSLERSKEAPLQIYLDMNQVRKKHGSVDLIAPCIHNVEALELTNLATVDDIIGTFPNFPQTMPNLRLLDLSLRKVSPYWVSTINPFGLFFPPLTQLSLHHIPLYPSFLKLKTLTEFTLHNYNFDLPLDVLLTVFEENQSLERVLLNIRLTKPSLLYSQRRAPIENRLSHLSVTYYNVEDARALISYIPIRKGAILEIDSRDWLAGLESLLLCIPTTHLGNLVSPTRLESHERNIRLLGPNGEFSFHGLSTPEMFLDGPFPVSLSNVREIHVRCPGQEISTICPRVFQPSSFPALEALVIKDDNKALITLSALLSTPASSPSLRTLAFLDCDLSGDLMKKLARFVSDRKKTSSARLHRVVIIHSGGNFPSFASIRTLGKQVPVVDVRFGTELPADLI